jgi:hypothetical protein
MDFMKKKHLKTQFPILMGKWKRVDNCLQIAQYEFPPSLPGMLRGFI